MLALLCAFGICFILRGAFMFTGRTVPKGVISKLQDKEKLKGWCRGTGTVHILWGIYAVMLWCANTFIPYALYALAVVAVSGVLSIIISLRTTFKYTNKT